MDFFEKVKSELKLFRRSNPHLGSVAGLVEIDNDNFYIMRDGAYLFFRKNGQKIHVSNDAEERDFSKKEAIELAIYIYSRFVKDTKAYEYGISNMTIEKSIVFGDIVNMAKSNILNIHKEVRDKLSEIIEKLMKDNFKITFTNGNQVFILQSAEDFAKHKEVFFTNIDKIIDIESQTQLVSVKFKILNNAKPAIYVKSRFIDIEHELLQKDNTGFYERFENIFKQIISIENKINEIKNENIHNLKL